MDQRLSLITLGVADLSRARAFYEALGWHTNAEPDDDVVFFQAGGMVVALWGREQLAAFREAGDVNWQPHVASCSRRTRCSRASSTGFRS